MGRAPCCSKIGLHRGPWSAREDKILINYIQTHGEGRWRSLAIKTGLMRCGKSCRLRWMNYLRPDIKRGNITRDEEDLIIRLHSLLGNRWSLIAGRLPGRTDNEIKNYWNSHLSKKLLNNNHKLPAPGDKKCKNDPNHEKKKRNNSKFHKADLEITTKSNVHLPRAIRLSRPANFAQQIGWPSSNDAVYKFGDHHQTSNAISNSTRSSSGQSSEHSVPGNYESLDTLAKNNNNNNNNNTCDSLCPTNDGDNNMLEDVFEEYQRLIKEADNPAQLDSFIDSLLA